MGEMLQRALDWAVAHPQEAASYVVAILAIYQAVRERLSLRESLLLLANVLKDEKKMPAGTFTPATVQKIETVAEVIGAGQTAVSEVKKVINDANAAVAAPNPDDHKGDLKVGSYNGKPIYLGQVTAIGSRLGAALGVLRGIIRR